MTIWECARDSQITFWECLTVVEVSLLTMFLIVSIIVLIFVSVIIWFLRRRASFYIRAVILIITLYLTGVPAFSLVVKSWGVDISFFESSNWPDIIVLISIVSLLFLESQRMRLESHERLFRGFENVMPRRNRSIRDMSQELNISSELINNIVHTISRVEVQLQHEYRRVLENIATGELSNERLADELGIPVHRIAEIMQELIYIHNRILGHNLP